MRDTDGKNDRAFGWRRLVESTVGLGLIGLGAYVFIKAPENAGAYAIILTTIGGVLFNREVVKPSNIRRILEK